MTKKKEILTNKKAIEELEKQHKHYVEEQNKLQTMILKAQGALEVLLLLHPEEYKSDS